MSEDNSKVPQIAASPEQWAELLAEERKRTAMQASFYRDVMRMQAGASSSLASIRDQFAMAALNMCAEYQSPAAAAKDAYEYADAMLKAREVQAND